MSGAGAGAAMTNDVPNFFKSRLTSGGGYPTLLWFDDEENESVDYERMPPLETVDGEKLDHDMKGLFI